MISMCFCFSKISFCSAFIKNRCPKLSSLECNCFVVSRLLLQKTRTLFCCRCLCAAHCRSFLSPAALKNSVFFTVSRNGPKEQNMVHTTFFYLQKCYFFVKWVRSEIRVNPCISATLVDFMEYIVLKKNTLDNVFAIQDFFQQNSHRGTAPPQKNKPIRKKSYPSFLPLFFTLNGLVYNIPTTGYTFEVSPNNTRQCTLNQTALDVFRLLMS